MLNYPIGVENVRLDLAPSLERHGAEELGLNFCVLRMATEE